MSAPQQNKDLADYGEKGLNHMTRRNRPVELTDAPEHRNIPIDRLEIRDAEGDNEYILEGYASTYQEYDMYGGPSAYGWIERIDRNAFDKTLRENPDLHLLVNHAGMPLARTKSGTMTLSADDHGLKVCARLDKRDPESQALAVKMERGDMNEMSFAFRVKGQEWRAADGYEDDDQSYRTITEVSLHKGDVSVVNWGANPTTSAEILSAHKALRAFVDADETEIRSEADAELIREALEKLSKIVNPEVTEEEPVAEEVREDNAATLTLEPGAISALLMEALRELAPEELTVVRELILGEGTDERSEEASTDETVDEAVEEARDESVEETSETTPSSSGLTLRDALAVDGEGTLSLTAIEFID